MTEPLRQEFVLSTLRCAALRVRLIAAEIDAAGVALKACIITDQEAVAWVEEIAPGCLNLVASSMLAEVPA
jgi:hypothetical protein